LLEHPQPFLRGSEWGALSGTAAFDTGRSGVASPPTLEEHSTDLSTGQTMFFAGAVAAAPSLFSHERLLQFSQGQGRAGLAAIWLSFQ
jgi:hypothetical protein